MSDEQMISDTEESSDYPVIEVDMRLFSVYVAGTTDDDLEDVEARVNEQVAKRLTEVKKLKRHDKELDEEFIDDAATQTTYSQ
jgi:hypothetical protein